jgi:hypothetical protein
MTVTIYGASDDLIEVEGDIRDEFTLQDDDDGDYLAFSDGTVLHVEYGSEGIWRIHQSVKGAAEFANVPGDDPEDNYTDRVTLTGDVGWVVHGRQLVRKS